MVINLIKSNKIYNKEGGGVTKSLLFPLMTVVLLYTAALEEQRITLAAAAAAANSTATESSPVAGPQENDKVDKIYEPLGIFQPIPRDGSATSTDQPNENVEEHQFIPNGPNLIGMSPMRDGQEGNGELNNLPDLENSADDTNICIGLHLGEREPKRLRSDSTLDIDLQK